VRPISTATFTRLRALKLEIPPDPLGIARALAAQGLEGIALLASTEPSDQSFVAAQPDRRSSALDPLSEEDEPRASGALTGAPRWIGVVPYEARRTLERPGWVKPDTRPEPLLTLPEWWRYRAVVTIDHRSGEVLVVGDDARAIDRLAKAARARPHPARAVELLLTDADPKEAHLERVARARELILDGDLYQVNLARRIDVHVKTGAPLDVFARLSHAAPAEYAAYLSLGQVEVLATSPELLLHAAVGPDDCRFARLVTEPIKGTRPRGIDAESDARLVQELDGDEKERAELAMIIDVERNDLARVCSTVRITKPPAVVTHRTVHHRRARLAGWVRDGVSRVEVLEAMLPSGSVTGAPKVRAMEVIADLEAHRRGLYTGGYGYVGHDGSMTLAMAIRTLVLQGTRGHYFTGGGIVADSDPERELQETGWKALQLQ